MSFWDCKVLESKTCPHGLTVNVGTISMAGRVADSGTPDLSSTAHQPSRDLGARPWVRILRASRSPPNSPWDRGCSPLQEPLQTNRPYFDARLREWGPWACGSASWFYLWAAGYN